MIGAMKCSGSGVRLLRNVTPATSNGLSASPLESSYGSISGGESCGAMNWSQKRFLRCLPPSSTSGTGNVNGQFTVNEIENQHKRLMEPSLYGNKKSKSNRSLSKENYSRSVRGHQSYLLSELENANLKNPLVTELYKIIVESGPATVRVKSNKDEALLREWIGIQNELQIIKQDRIEEDKRRLQIAGQQALREMEASLRKGMNLEDLDEAIEGALCSELKDH